jgi:TonB family protein
VRPPAYPPLAAAARTAGTVTVHLRIGRAGNVEAARATRGHPILLPAAVDYVRALRFRPVDNPVEIDLRIRFSLSERRGSRLQATFDGPGEVAIESPQPDPEVQFSVATRPR